MLCCDQSTPRGSIDWEKPMENSLPLHLCHFPKLQIFINRSHRLIHSFAICFLVYYRVSFFFQDPEDRAAPTSLWLLVFASELLLSFVWLLGQAFNWRPVYRTVFPEGLPEDDKLPALDVFICTADPNKEPIMDVMNTLLSAMALDYPARKLHVYLSDDGGAALTFYGTKEAWKFARSWLTFCKKFGIKTRCPKAYFLASVDDDCGSGSSGFVAERQIIEEKYEDFKESVTRFRHDVGSEDKNTSRDRPAVIEVMQEDSNEEIQEDQAEMPLLVYVSREQRPPHPHHFKAGALNVLLRVSGLISNSPYILMLDCDMYCNDPTSARQALCFHLDPQMSSSLAFVQFPQRFHNISKKDIYDSVLRSTWGILWPGMDGLKGPVLSGTGFYIKRESLYGNAAGKANIPWLYTPWQLNFSATSRSFVCSFVGELSGDDLSELKNSFGCSNEFIKSLFRNNEGASGTDGRNLSSTCQEAKFLASCAYEGSTKWGKEVGFLYQSVAEDFFTGFLLHCKGWTSVYLDPPRPQFLGASVTNLNDLLVQGSRWSSGVVQLGLSRFFPLIYGTQRMSFLESACYAEISIFPVCYCLSLWCFGTIPPLCLLNGIPLYPEVSSPFFIVFLFIFASAIFKQMYEVIITKGSIEKWLYEQRLWMMKSMTIHTYGTLDAIMTGLGVWEANFLPSNKVGDEDNFKFYEIGKFDFRTSSMLLVPMVGVVILNMISFVGGTIRTLVSGDWDHMFVQEFLSLYILLVNYAIIEGMMIRTDKGRIQSSVAFLSAAFSLVFIVVFGIFAAFMFS